MFWRFLGQCVYLVLVLPVVWVWIGMEIFWLFSVSVCMVGTVSFAMTVPAFVCYLLMLSSKRVKCGDRAVIGIWV